MKESSEVTQ